MADLAESTGTLEMGITQITEIVPHRGVTLVGALPAELQNIAIYSVGLGSRSENSDCSREFIRCLTGFTAQPLLSAAGFDIGR